MDEPFSSPGSSREGLTWAVCTAESPQGALQPRASRETADAGGLQGDMSHPWRSSLRAGPGCLVCTIGLSPLLSGLRGCSRGATGSQPSPVLRGSHRGSLG